MDKDLSIIVTSYKSPSVLKLCLEALQKNVLNENYEILVVDSATEEDTEMLMREEFPEIKFFPSVKNLGFAKLVNCGLRNAQGRFILIINADIIVGKTSVDCLVEYVKNNPDVGIAGPKLLNFDRRPQHSFFRFYRPSTILFRRTFLGKFGFGKKTIDKFLMKDKDSTQIIEPDWLMGSALMTTRANTQKIGPMEESFFMYFEDVDWCRRFWENGLRIVYYPLVEMFHYHGRGSASQNALEAILFNKLTRVHIRSAIKYFLKYRGKPNPHRE